MNGETLHILCKDIINEELHCRQADFIMNAMTSYNKSCLQFEVMYIHFNMSDIKS